MDDYLEIKQEQPNVKHSATWIDPKGIMLSLKKNQPQKDYYSMYSMYVSSST